MPARVCLTCGQLTSRPSKAGRCPDCQAERDQARPTRAVYDTPRWRRLSTLVIRQWVEAHGWWCPGYGRSGHPSQDLTADHSEPLALLMARGADLWDRANIAVLCRSCNGRKASQRSPRST